MVGRSIRRKHRDEGVSPVIATIILVAIAVVISAPLYSWATGVRTETEQPANALAVTSTSPILGGVKELAVASATPGLRWTGLALSLDGAPLVYDAGLGDDGEYCVASPGMTCAAGSSPPDRLVGAGDILRVQHSALAGRTLRVVDVEANSVIVATTLR